MSEPIHGILFDMDDTLIDWHNFSGDWHNLERRHLKKVYEFLAENERTLDVSLERFVQVYRERVVDAWEAARTTLRAPHMTKIMEEVISEFGFVADDAISLRDIMVAYQWQGADGIVVFPDVPDGLQKLIDMGIKIGIVTNAFQPMWLRDAELEKYDLLKYFPDEVVRMSAADVGYLKPHKQIFHHALECLGTKAENTLYIGDNPVADIGGAQAVNMRAVLRINHGHRPLITDMLVPDAVITNFGELVTLVEDWDAQVASFQLKKH